MPCHSPGRPAFPNETLPETVSTARNMELFAPVFAKSRRTCVAPTGMNGDKSYNSSSGERLDVGNTGFAGLSPTPPTVMRLPGVGVWSDESSAPPAELVSRVPLTSICPVPGKFGSLNDMPIANWAMKFGSFGLAG